MTGLKSRRSGISRSLFYSCLLLISICYLAYEYYYIPRWSLAADEFVFARHIYDYTFRIPYLDFAPYKTVLGYYLLSIPMFFSHALLKPLFYIKDEIAIINVFCLVTGGYWACRFYDKRAVLLIILAIIANQLFLVYSSELRVDMLTSWFCLFSGLAVLQKYLRTGGTLLGIAFLISQKTIWYLFAIDGALMICMLLPASSYTLRSLWHFNLFMTITVVIYIVIWSMAVPPGELVHNLFYEAYTQARTSWYMHIYYFSWMTLLRHGPVLFLLWPATFLSLLLPAASQTAGTHSDKIFQQRVFAASFSTIALLLFISYKQPFPYNFVFTIPAFFLLYSDFISWLLALKTRADENAAPGIHASSISCLMSLYTVGIFYFLNRYDFDLPYYVLVFFPLVFGYLLRPAKNNPRIPRIAYKMIFVIFVSGGIIYPLYQSMRLNTYIRGDYQQAMIKMSSELLGRDGEFIGGIPFIYYKEQPVEGVRNLISPAIAYLFKPKASIKPLLLPSLYLAPATQEEVLANFDKSPVKVIINNVRMASLPPAIKAFVADNYRHFYGSIYLYAPSIQPQQLSFILKFTARYRINSSVNSQITIDGKNFRPGQIIKLNKGDHTNWSSHAYHLELQPDVNVDTSNPKYQTDNFLDMFRSVVI